MAADEEVAQVRAELRAAVRQLDTVTSAIVMAIDHAQRILGDEPTPKRTVRLTTPADDEPRTRFLG